MADGLFDKMDGFLKAIRGIALDIAWAIVAAFVLCFLALSAYRLLELLWRSVFGHPWGI